MRHFKEHKNHKYTAAKKKKFKSQGYSGKVEKVINIHFQEHLKNFHPELHFDKLNYCPMRIFQI